jgi:hypothetical protein
MRNHLERIIFKELLDSTKYLNLLDPFLPVLFSNYIGHLRDRQNRQRRRETIINYLRIL